MIIVQLKGGLGNQLFQYAAGLSLASHHGVPLKVDIAELFEKKHATDTARAFDLEKFNCNPVVANEAEIASVLQSSALKKWTDKLKPCYKRLDYKEAAFFFDPHFFQSGNHIYLRGYRQSEKYFQHIEVLIRQQFVIKPVYTNPVKELAEKLRSHNSVAVHIRRKDYLSAAYSKIHGALPADYYNRAAELIAGKTDQPVFYIFSDDPEWVKANFNIGLPVVFITPEMSNAAITDFYLISSCRHQVIANSTFSWWAAWLNDNTGKMVVAPNKWFNEAAHNTKDLVPANWIRI
ncbi:MAG: alpha-1,2-fucosyltransferase [Ferruginibacter sp.]